MLTFERYRPTSHFIPPHSWSNDPCGAVFIPETQEYLLCYQWNPGTTEAGNSAWGMARSKDLITWHDCAPPISNGVDTAYDSYGVFSGSIYSRLVEGRRVLHLFYTSIGKMPYPHWSKPYISGESQSVAFSTDFGRSWHRYQHNPLLSDAPARSFTTGWRDPFISEWDSLSRLRGTDSSTKYMMLASGDKRSGPQLFIYESQDLLEWKPLSVFLQGQTDKPIVPGSNLHYGRNFECNSFFTIGEKDYITCGVEQHPSQTNRQFSRYTLWMSGRLELNAEGRPVFSIVSFGRLDDGLLYAPHIFRGPDGEILQLGWTDEDQNQMTNEQRWAGCLTTPRELCETQVPKPDFPILEEHIWSIDTERGIMSTLGIRPAHQMKGLRQGSKLYNLNNIVSLQSLNFEIEATFSLLSGDETLTFNVRQSPHDREVTRVVISLPNNTIFVDRSASSLANGNPTPDAGIFQLFRTESSRTSSLEDLHIRIYVDNSIIEVFANDRFVISSRVYPTLDTALGVSCDFKKGNGTALMPKGCISFDCWDGLANAWPGRTGPRKGNAEMIDEKNMNQVQIAEQHMQAIVA